MINLSEFNTYVEEIGAVDDHMLVCRLHEYVRDRTEYSSSYLMGAEEIFIELNTEIDDKKVTVAAMIYIDGEYVPIEGTNKFKYLVFREELEDLIERFNKRVVEINKVELEEFDIEAIYKRVIDMIEMEIEFDYKGHVSQAEALDEDVMEFKEYREEYCMEVVHVAIHLHEALDGYRDDIYVNLIDNFGEVFIQIAQTINEESYVELYHEIDRMIDFVNLDEVKEVVTRLLGGDNDE